MAQFPPPTLTASKNPPALAIPASSSSRILDTIHAAKIGCLAKPRASATPQNFLKTFENSDLAQPFNAGTA